MTTVELCKALNAVQELVNGRLGYSGPHDDIEAGFEAVRTSIIDLRPSAPAGVTEGAQLAERVKEAAETADKVLGGPEGETILGYTIPTGKWLMLQADLRNFLERLAAPLPNPEADELREALGEVIPLLTLAGNVAYNMKQTTSTVESAREFERINGWVDSAKAIARAALTKETTNGRR